MISKEKAGPDRESDGGREEGGRGSFDTPDQNVPRDYSASWRNKKVGRSAPPPFQEKGLFRDEKNALSIATARTRTASGMTRGDPNK